MKVQLIVALVLLTAVVLNVVRKKKLGVDTFLDRVQLITSGIGIIIIIIVFFINEW